MQPPGYGRDNVRPCRQCLCIYVGVRDKLPGLRHSDMCIGVPVAVMAQWPPDKEQWIAPWLSFHCHVARRSKLVANGVRRMCDASSLAKPENKDNDSDNKQHKCQSGHTSPMPSSFGAEERKTGLSPNKPPRIRAQAKMKQVAEVVSLECRAERKTV